MEDDDDWEAVQQRMEEVAFEVVGGARGIDDGEDDVSLGAGRPKEILGALVVAPSLRIVDRGAAIVSTWKERGYRPRSIGRRDEVQESRHKQQAELLLERSRGTPSTRFGSAALRVFCC